jgi:hypothetical protein
MVCCAVAISLPFQAFFFTNTILCTDIFFTGSLWQGTRDSETVSPSILFLFVIHFLALDVYPKGTQHIYPDG